MNTKVKKQTMIIGGTIFGVLATTGVIAGIIFGIKNMNGDFETEKSQIWEMIKETPNDTAHVVFINGFVGTSLVEKYLFESVQGKFSVDIIRSYVAAGRTKNEQERVAKYNQEFSHNNLNKQANVIDKPNRLSHMKSYFWFNDKKEIIRSFTGSGNFSESALLKVPSYKEVLYNITNYKGLGRDIFCGGISATEQINTIRINALYQQNCTGFDVNDKATYQSEVNVLKEKSQFNEIVKAHRANAKMKTATGLLVLTGDGDTNVIKRYLDETAEDNISLDLFIGNTSAGYNPNDERILLKDEKNINRLNIIREHPKPNVSDFDFIKYTKPKTHTKLYVWYNAHNEILAFWSGSANFSTNGLGLDPKKDHPFREILFEMSLSERDWKNDLICNVVGAFKTPPSQRIKNFCAN